MQVVVLVVLVALVALVLVVKALALQVPVVEALPLMACVPEQQ